VLFTIIPVFNCVALGFMLWAEVKARGFTTWKDARAVIILTMIWLQLLMFILFGFL